jgi:hypothetical protein
MPWEGVGGRKGAAQVLLCPMDCQLRAAGFQHSILFSRRTGSKGGCPVVPNGRTGSWCAIYAALCARPVRRITALPVTFASHGLEPITSCSPVATACRAKLTDVIVNVILNAVSKTIPPITTGARNFMTALLVISTQNDKSKRFARTEFLRANCARILLRN